MLSPEIQLFIDAIKSQLMNEQPRSTHPVDVDVLQKKWWFHSIRPVLHQFFKNNTLYNVPHSITNELTSYVQTQTFVSLRYSHEVNRLLTIFQSGNLSALPYKGVLFVYKLYGNQQLREVGDIDLLFHPKDAAEGMRLLLADGYSIEAVDNSFRKMTDSEFIELVLSTKNQYEITFRKGSVQLDFHWGLYHGFLPFQVDSDRFFTTAVATDSNGTIIKTPSVETLFWMMVVHHGGKENWTRLKHLADLIAFLNRFQAGISWPQLFETAREYRLQQVLIVGFRLLKKHFDYSLSDQILEEIKHYQSTDNVEKLIENYWDEATIWDTVLSRLRKERLFINIQDADFSKSRYFAGFYRTYAKPNPLENRRIVTFPDNYPTLNFISKVVTHFVRKFR